MIVGMKVRHYINGQDFGEPRNWQELKIVKDWLNKKENVTINVTDLEFVLKANKYLQQRVLNGLTGGVGIFEGEPYTIEIGDPSSPVYSFNGYLDFTDGATVIGGEEFVCSLKKREGSDWLNEVADGFSFAYLADQNLITGGDYVKVPYVINYIPDGMQLIMLSLSLFMMTKELIENAAALAEAIGIATDASTPVIGVSIGFGAGVVTAWDLGNFVFAILKIVARIIYIIAIVIAIVKLIEQIFEQLLPKKRYHIGMTLRVLFQRGCQHLGLGFTSNIQELDWVHIPSKDRKGGESGESGHPLSTGPIGTFGDLIRVYKKAFNADYRIINGVLHFNRRDSFDIISNYQVPNFFGNQERMLDNIKFNTDEMVANYNIHWAYDTQDQNTLDDQRGRIFQAITTPVSVIDQKMVNIKNLAEIDLPFSIGKCKTELTRVEEVAKDLGKFVDKITGIFGGGTNFASQIKNRIGSLLLSSHFLTVGKMVKMSGGKLAQDQRTDLAASLLWEKYHFINSFAEVNGVHNQYWRFLGVPVPMTLEECSELIETNKVTDSDGNEVEIEKIEYEPQSGSAIIDFRVKKKYTNNLKVEYVS